MNKDEIKEIINKIEKAYNLRESSDTSELVNNDGWQSEIEDEVLEEIAKNSNISTEELIEIIEEYRHDNKDNNIKDKRGSNSVKYVILGGGAIILIGVGYFLYQIATTYKTTNRKNINTVSHKQEKRAKNKKNHLELDSVKFKTVNNSKTEVKQLEKKENPKINISNNTRKEVEVEKNPIKKDKKSAQCFTKTKYVNKEVVYYIFNSNMAKYIPVFESDNWDKRGYKLQSKLISEDIDDSKNMVEVQKGKWLPLKLFTTCSIINK